MRIVLDTTVLCSDQRLAGAAFQVFSEAAPAMGARLCVPEVVFDEAVAHHARAVETLIGNLKGLAAKARRLSGQWVAPSGLLSSLRQARDGYEAFLRARLEAMHTDFLPYPTIPHRDIALRAMRRRKPFRESGVGYRDSLLWLTVLDSLQREREPLALVTANSKDFGSGPELPPELEAEAWLTPVPTAWVVVYPSLQALNNVLITSELPPLDDLARQLSSDELPGFSLSAWGKTRLVEVLNDGEWARDIAGLDVTNGDARFVQPISVKDVSVDDIRRLPSGDSLVFASLRLKAVLEVSGDLLEIQRSEELQDFLGKPDGGSSGWATTEVPSSPIIAFTLILGRDDHQVKSYEIDFMESKWRTYSVNPHPRDPDCSWAPRPSAG